MSRRIPLLTTLIAVLALVPAATSLAADAHSPNMSHVKNLAYETRNGGTTSGGTDIEFASHRGRQYAFAGSYRNGMQIFDITNPEQTRRVGLYDCGITQGDVQIFRQRDESGRLFATYTSDTVNDGTSRCNKEAQRLGFQTQHANGTGKNGTFIVDVTQPRKPKTVAFIEVVQGSHNMTVHPSGNYMYNSNSDLITSVSPAIEIVDISNPKRPALLPQELPLKTFPGLGTESHDITFNDSGTRAYSAALSHGAIIDTTNPAAPKIISEWEDPTINVWHQADPFKIGDREFVIAEDEMYGAAGGPHCPSGGVHIYEVTGEMEKAPVKVGYWNIDEIRATSSATGRCTAHVFDIHEKEQIMTIAFYNGGVRVVDLSGLADASRTSLALGATGSAGAMKEIGFYRFEGMDSWSAKTPFIERDGDFYLYGNDQRRGLDVYRFEAEDQKSSKKGKFMNAREAAVALSGRKASAAALRDYRMFCLVGGK
jgi:LVIVD repeat